MIIGIDGTVFVDKLTGIGRYCFELLNELAKNNKEDTFYVYTPFNLSVEFFSPNIVVRKSKILNRGKRFNRIKKLIWFHFFLPIFLKSDKIDVFWSGNGITPIIKTTKQAITIHDFVYKRFANTMHFMSYYNRKFFQAISIKNADIIFTNSKTTADELNYYFSKDVDEIVKPSVSEIFKSKSQEEIKSVKLKYSLPENYNIIVATFEPRKNLELFISIYMENKQDYQSLSPLVMVGKSGWKDSNLKKQIEKGIQKRLIYETGYVDFEDLPALYSGANIFFMPSIYEGFGIPIIEAKKCSCMVVCSDVEAMKEAGGKDCLYHRPTRDGIEKVLKYISNNNLKQNNLNFITPSWQMGAEQIINTFRRL